MAYQDDDNVQNVAAVTNLVTGMVDNIFDFQAGQAGMEEALKKLEFNNAITLATEENKRNYTLTRDNLVKQRDQNDVKIDNLMTTINQHMLVNDDIATLPQQFKTDGMQKYLNSKGVEIGENWKFTEMVNNDTGVELDQTNHVIGMQDLSINFLSSVENNILNEHKHFKDIRDAGLVQGEIDAHDVIRHVNENPAKYAKYDADGNPMFSEYGKTTLFNEDGTLKTEDELKNVTIEGGKLLYEPNYLGIAIQTPQGGGGLGGSKYGFINQKRVEKLLDLEAANVVTNRKAANTSSYNINKDDWENSFAIQMDNILSSEENLIDDNEQMFTFINDAMEGKASTLSGSKDRFNTPNAAMLMKSILEDKIGSMLGYGLQDETNEITGLVDLISNKKAISPGQKTAVIRTIFKKIMPETGETKHGTTGLLGYIERGENRWASKDMGQIDFVYGPSTPGAQDAEERLLLKYLNAWKMMDDQFPEMNLASLKNEWELSGGSASGTTLMDYMTNYVTEHEGRFTNRPDIGQNKINAWSKFYNIVGSNANAPTKNQALGNIIAEQDEIMLNENIVSQIMAANRQGTLNIGTQVTDAKQIQSSLYETQLGENVSLLKPEDTSPFIEGDITTQAVKPDISGDLFSTLLNQDASIHFGGKDSVDTDDIMNVLDNIIEYNARPDTVGGDSLEYNIRKMGFPDLFEEKILSKIKKK